MVVMVLCTIMLGVRATLGGAGWGEGGGGEGGGGGGGDGGGGEEDVTVSSAELTYLK